MPCCERLLLSRLTASLGRRDGFANAGDYPSLRPSNDVTIDTQRDRGIRVAEQRRNGPQVGPVRYRLSRTRGVPSRTLAGRTALLWLDALGCRVSRFDCVFTHGPFRNPKGQDEDVLAYVLRSCVAATMLAGAEDRRRLSCTPGAMPQTSVLRHARRSRPACYSVTQ